MKSKKTLPRKAHAAHLAAPATVKPVARAAKQLLLGFTGLCLAAYTQIAIAADFVVDDIKIEGLSRVEAGSVFGALPVKVGQRYSDEVGSLAIRTLYALGLFKDVRLDQRGNTLVVVVQERPSIGKIELLDFSEFDKDLILNALKDQGLSEGRAYDKALVDRAEQDLKRQYVGRSLFAAEVVTTVSPIDNNRVNLTLKVVEGTRAKVSEISITGNKAYSNGTLLGLMDTEPTGFMSWYTRSDRYSKAKVAGDIENVRQHYLNNGYLEFKVDSSSVALSPDKTDLKIAIDLNEGQRFTLSEVKLDGSFLGKEAEFKSLVGMQVGKPYNQESLNTTVKAFTDYFATFGYAFAKVDARPEVDRTKGTVAITLSAAPQQRAYVRRINIAGNNKTRDAVIRREMRQLEASWYEGEKIKQSKERIDRLGFFKDTNLDAVEVPGTPDQVDLNIKVEEKATGNLNLGAGYSSTDKLSLVFGIKQENFLGSGRYLAVDVNTSKTNRNLVVSATNPYFTESGVSNTLDVYHRTTKPANAVDGDYKLITTGGSTRFGIPITENDRVFLGLGVEQNNIVQGTNMPSLYQQYYNQYGAKSKSLPLTLGWGRDTRNSALTPTSGQSQRFNFEVSPALDARYVKASFQYQYYLPLTRKFTLALNSELGWGKGLSDRPFPVFKNSFSGGLGTVRGFKQGTLGPLDSATGAHSGGPKKFNTNLEFYAPFPGVGTDKSLRWYTFVDVGNVYAENAKYSAKELRAAAGVGLSWISPIGPLNFSYGKPLRSKPTDSLQKFQFQIGTSF